MPDGAGPTTPDDAGAQHQRDVSVCGTMASDPLAALLLVGMGVRSLSLAAPEIPRVKAALSRFSLAEAATVARHAFRYGTARDVEGTIVEELGPRIADLLDSDTA